MLNPDLLLGAAALAAPPGGQHEADVPQRCLLHHSIPQLALAWQHPVMLTTYQVIGRVAQLARLDHQAEYVALAVSDTHMARLGQQLGALSDALITLDPAGALAHAASVAISALELARPAPGI